MVRLRFKGGKPWKGTPIVGDSPQNMETLEDFVWDNEDVIADGDRLHLSIETVHRDDTELTIEEQEELLLKIGVETIDDQTHLRFGSVPNIVGNWFEATVCGLLTSNGQYLFYPFANDDDTTIKSNDY